MYKLLMATCVLAMGLFIACEDQGPAERAGESIDDTAEKMGEKMEEAGEEMEH